mmetsp:Transcript_44578/g.96983  ORF Transcript_44578/g.96983 Transcript_44578/m.96983 type:complete len:251 (-) Transcript_44578:3-755(-)
MGMNPMMGMGMNPMMAAMMRPGMGMNPMMMGMNPMMMAAMQSGMANMMGSGGSTAATAASPDTAIDTRVRKFCREYNIDDKVSKKLNDALLAKDDFDENMQALWMIMEKSVAKNKRPLDVILVKMREIMKGDFPGKDLLEPGIKAFYQKYDLDDRTLNRLINILKMRGSKRDQDLRDIDGRLSSSGIKAPGGLLVRMLDGLEEFGRIPSPPRRLGGSGVSNRNFLGGRESASAGDRERGRDRRSRSRGRR